MSAAVGGCWQRAAQRDRWRAGTSAQLAAGRRLVESLRSPAPDAGVLVDVLEALEEARPAVRELAALVRSGEVRQARDLAGSR